MHNHHHSHVLDPRGISQRHRRVYWNDDRNCLWYRLVSVGPNPPAPVSRLLYDVFLTVDSIA